ncbi:zinc finger protein 26-like [Bradysia coprophila]|uniref:zinc finger protein 26-like n=1 Tax=Bradysia coprophila TaxID=38358 RepID=UPI00187DBAC5|nr:zinc finger protein 26-like [Bradysia coprophila]
MNSIVDPLEANGRLKSATIYRNSEYNYIYVCYHCECSFTNILDTLTHVESHFDAKFEAKVNMTHDNLRFTDSRSECITDNKTETVPMTENVNGVMFSDCNDPGNLGYEFTIVEQKYQHHKQNEDHAHFSETTNEVLLIQCEHCDQKFYSSPLLIIHMIQHHSNMTSLTCPQCFESWTDESEFSSHLQQHIDVSDTTYERLIEKMKSKAEVTVKIEIEQCPRKYKKKCLKRCDICSSTFATKEQIIAHMRQQHIKQPDVKKMSLDCEKCNRKIEGKFAFYAHQYGHLINDTQMNDDILQINLKKYLNASVFCDETNPDEPKYGCSICNQISVKKRFGALRHIMQQHIYLMKANKQKRFACEYCGRKFALSNNLKVHERTHTGSRPFKCLVCNKSFTHSSYMRYHEKIHTGLQDFQCSICGRTFRTNNKLNFHIKCHANIMKKCPICDKELKAHRLSLHIRNVHENEHRPYKCEICTQAFKTAKTLRTHSYRHSDEKKFECRHHCKEKFTSSSSRRAHERSKHEAH